MRRLAQGHLDTQLGGARDRTSNLPVVAQPVAQCEHTNVGSLLDQSAKSEAVPLQRGPMRPPLGGRPVYTWVGGPLHGCEQVSVAWLCGFVRIKASVI